MENWPENVKHAPLLGKKGNVFLWHASIQVNGDEAVLLTPVNLAFTWLFGSLPRQSGGENDRPRTFHALSACSFLRNAFSPLGF